MLIEADASGGQVVVEIHHRNKCVEKVRYEWRFDTDIRYLRYKQRLNQITSVNVSGDCDRNPFAKPHHWPKEFILFRGRLSEEEREARSITLIASTPQVQGDQRVFGKRKEPHRRSGTSTDTFEVETEQVSQYHHMIIGINLYSSSKVPEVYDAEVLYMFAAVYADTPPGEQPIQADHPASGADLTVSLPNEGTTPVTSRQTSSDGPRRDSAGQSIGEAGSKQSDSRQE